MRLKARRVTAFAVRRPARCSGSWWRRSRKARPVIDLKTYSSDCICRAWASDMQRELVCMLEGRKAKCW